MSRFAFSIVVVLSFILTTLAKEDISAIIRGNSFSAECKSPVTAVWSFYGRGNSIGTILATGNKARGSFKSDRWKWKKDTNCFIIKFMLTRKGNQAESTVLEISKRALKQSGSSYIFCFQMWCFFDDHLLGTREQAAYLFFCISRCLCSSCSRHPRQVFKNCFGRFLMQMSRWCLVECSPYSTSSYRFFHYSFSPQIIRNIIPHSSLSKPS